MKRKNEEEKRLEEINNEIRYYDAFNELALKFNNPKTIEYQSNEFEEDYKEICKCIEYFQERKNDVVNYTYLIKYQQLKSKILSYLSIYIKKEIESLHMNVQMKQVLPLKDFTHCELYVNTDENVTTNKNVMKVNEINDIITSINSTKGIIESSYIYEIIKYYINIRKNILIPYVNKLLNTLHQINPSISDIAREGGIYLFIIFYKESKQFKMIFNEEYQSFKMMLNEIFDVYKNYVTLLSHKCNDISNLCSTITYLKDEQIIYRLPHSKLLKLSEYLIFDFCLKELITNVSERLVYIALQLINRLIVGFKPSQNDLNYPEIFKTSNISDLPFKLVLFPPTTTTLTLLSKLHFTLNEESFSQIGNNAIKSCIDIIMKWSKDIKGTAKKTKEMKENIDGKLFALRNLMILRDQIMPFKEITESINHIEMITQELVGEVCNYFLKILTPNGIQTSREVNITANGNEIVKMKKNIINEVKLNINVIKEELKILSVYLHQSHQKELIEIFKARIIFLSRKLSLLFNKDEEFEKEFNDLMNLIF